MIEFSITYLEYKTMMTGFTIHLRQRKEYPSCGKTLPYLFFSRSIQNKPRYIIDTVLFKRIVNLFLLFFSPNASVLHLKFPKICQSPGLKESGTHLVRSIKFCIMRHTCGGALSFSFRQLT